MSLEEFRMDRRGIVEQHRNEVDDWVPDAGFGEKNTFLDGVPRLRRIDSQAVTALHIEVAEFELSFAKRVKNQRRSADRTSKG